MLKDRLAHLTAAVVAVLFCWLALPTPVDAGFAYTVNIEEDLLADDADCSLREAIQSFNEQSEKDGEGGCVGDPQTDTNISIDRITLAAETYVLDLQGSDEDDNTTGDLDINFGDGTGDAPTSNRTLIIQGAGMDATIIETDWSGGDDRDRVFHIVLPVGEFEGAFTVIFQDLTIQGGDITGAGSVMNDGKGGGIKFVDGDTDDSGESARHTLRLRRVRVTENAALTGGGIFFSGGRLELIASEISENMAVDGFCDGDCDDVVAGGIAVMDADPSTEAVEITGGSRISNNTAISDGTNDALSGGLILLNIDELLIQDSFIEGNEVVDPSSDTELTPFGAGMVMFMKTDAVALIENTIISDNHISDNDLSSAGGIFIDFNGKKESQVTLQDVTISNNSAAAGGGLLALNANVDESADFINHLTCLRCSIFGNEADGTDPAAMTLLSGDVATGGDGGGLVSVGVRTLIWNSTVANNEASDEGGGIVTGAYSNQNGELDLINVTITGNQADTAGGLHLANLSVDDAANDASEVTISNTILAGNSLSSGTTGIECATDLPGQLISAGFNLFAEDPNPFTDCGLVVQTTSDILAPASSLGLGSLVESEDAGRSHVPLLAASLAIDNANDQLCVLDLASDQLEQSRDDIPGAGSDGELDCDIGAYEFQAEVADDEDGEDEGDDGGDETEAEAEVEESGGGCRLVAELRGGSVFPAFFMVMTLAVLLVRRRCKVKS